MAKETTSMVIGEEGNGFNSSFKSRAFTSSLVGEDDDGKQYDLGNYLHSTINNVPSSVSHQEARDLLMKLYGLTTFHLDETTEIIKVEMNDMRS